MADSMLEARRWEQLLLLHRAGMITDLTWHPRYSLPGGVIYEADSAYIENGRIIVEDVKGFETQVWRLKRRMFLAAYPHIELKIVTREDI